MFECFFFLWFYVWPVRARVSDRVFVRSVGGPRLWSVMKMVVACSLVAFSVVLGGYGVGH